MDMDLCQFDKAAAHLIVNVSMMPEWPNCRRERWIEQILLTEKRSNRILPISLERKNERSAIHTSASDRYTYLVMDLYIAVILTLSLQGVMSYNWQSQDWLSRNKTHATAKAFMSSSP
jgi:hypothetical protein